MSPSYLSKNFKQIKNQQGIKNQFWSCFLSHEQSTVGLLNMSTTHTNLPKKTGYKTVITVIVEHLAFCPYDCILTKDLICPFSHLKYICKDKSRAIL